MAQNGFVGFRASEALSDALAAAAEAEGVSISELVRQSVEDRLARPTPSKVGETFNIFAALGPAARGSLQAQRDIANAAVAQAFSGAEDVDPARMLLEGLCFARLAAAHGHIEDQGLVISMMALLMQVAGAEACEDEMAEAIARMEVVAAQGGEGADLTADAMAGLVADAPPQVAVSALYYQEQFKGAAKANAPANGGDA